MEEEIGKLRVLEPASSEYNVTRNYLDWLTSMPYGLFNEETFDIVFGRECLDADHYGMQDVKDRILEFIAVGKLNDRVQVRLPCGCMQRPRPGALAVWLHATTASRCACCVVACKQSCPACNDRVQVRLLCGLMPAGWFDALPCGLMPCNEGCDEHKRRCTLHQRLPGL